MATPFTLPNLGEDVQSATVTRVMVAEGDRIQANQNVVEIETGKATVEVPCPLAGVVRGLKVKEGSVVAAGDALFEVETEGAAAQAPAAPPPAAPKAPAAPAAPKEAPPPAAAQAPPPAAKPPAAPPAAAAAAPLAPPAPAAPSGRVVASPSVRRLARTLGIDLAQVGGSGPGGRVTQADLERHAEARAAAPEAPAAPPASGPASPRPAATPLAGPAGDVPPLPDFSPFGPTESVAMSTIRRLTAEHMSLAWRLIPHVTQFEEVDVTELEAFRARYKDSAAARGGKLTMTVLIIKAVASALKAFPDFNASLDAAAGRIVRKKYYHIGCAVDTERGLLVPVLRDVDRKDMFELARELTDLSERARQGKIKPDELAGGTFTVTNLGGIAGTAFAPIINYPEAAILGVARSREECRLVAGALATRLVLPLCLSYDHRIIDGAGGARFVRSLAESLENPERLLLGL